MTGLLGMVALLGLGYLFSQNRKKIRWRTVLGGLAIQFCFAMFVLVLPWGKNALTALTSLVDAIIAAGQKGIEFVFGPIGNYSLGFVFAFNVLPVIIFFSSFIAVLYHLKVMDVVVRLIGGAIRKILKTSPAESLSATANIFVGQTEAPLVVKPYIAGMTRSELFAVMVGGLASVAGSVMAGYAGMGVELKFLLAASFMSAPGGLLFAKLLLPETETAQQKVSLHQDEERPVNVIDAAARGAADGLQLALNVGAMLLAFVGLIAVIDLGLGLLGGLSLTKIMAWVFSPVAWILGIPWSECSTAGSLLGMKVVANEFIAFERLVALEELSQRSRAILTFALCGFANLSSIAILLGGLGGMAPSRRPEIARLGLLAVYAATCSNLMSACLAGLFIS